MLGRITFLDYCKINLVGTKCFAILGGNCWGGLAIQLTQYFPVLSLAFVA